MYVRFFFVQFVMNPVVIIPAGMATIAIPNMDEIMVIILPAVVTGYISP